MDSLDHLLPVAFVATVEHGDGYGHVLGYPTANVDSSRLQDVAPGLPHGVYAGYVVIAGGRRYPAGIVVGSEDLHGRPKTEAHLIGFDGDLYGCEVRFEILRYLRPYRAFDRVDELINQISVDLQQVQAVLLSFPEILHPPHP